MPKKFAILLVSLSVAIGLVFTNPFAIYADSDVFDSTNYTLVDYVSPNGNNVYINSGYKPKYNTEVYAVFSTTANTSGRFLYGVASSSNSYGFNIGSTYRVRTLNGTSNTSLDGIFPINTIVTINQGLSDTTATDGNTTYSASYTQGNSSLTSNMFIFCLNASGTATNYLNGAKLYDLKIYESSSLIHHYYPCFRKSDNVVGIYDGIDGTFISSTGGNLSYGSIATTQYTITTSVSPAGSGTVTGGGTYDSGDVITLTATPNTGYSFLSWSDLNTDNPRTVSVNSNQSYEAIFTQVSPPSPTQYTITTSVSPNGSGSVSGGGTYDSGDVITLTATPNMGYVFGSWSDGNIQNPRQIEVTSNATYTAIFTDDVSSQIILGSYIDIIDIERYTYISTILGTITSTGNNSSVINFYTSNSPVVFDAIYEVNIIFNNDYIGKIIVNYSINNVSYSKTIYVNGNSCKFTYSGSQPLDFIISSINTSNLSLKESVNNAIYNGNQESQEANNNFNNSNDDLTDLSGDIFELENDFNDNLNDSLDNIDPDFSFDTGFGSKFLSSANFVKDQFDFLTQNNAFGSLLSFSLLLGLGLLIIGKVL